MKYLHFTTLLNALLESHSLPFYELKIKVSNVCQ